MIYAVNNSVNYKVTLNASEEANSFTFSIIPIKNQKVIIAGEAGWSGINSWTIATAVSSSMSLAVPVVVPILPTTIKNIDNLGFGFLREGDESIEVPCSLIISGVVTPGTIRLTLNNAGQNKVRMN